MRVEVEVEGVERTMQKMHEKSAKALKLADKTLEETVRTVVVPFAKELCPVETGTLRDSIRSEWKGWGVVAIGTPVKYGKYQEFGFYISKEFAEHAAWGKGMPWLEGQFMKHPFLIPAIEGTRDIVLMKIQEAINSAVRKR